MSFCSSLSSSPDFGITNGLFIFVFIDGCITQILTRHLDHEVSDVKVKPAEFDHESKEYATGFISGKDKAIHEISRLLYIFYTAWFLMHLLFFLFIVRAVDTGYSLQQCIICQLIYSGGPALRFNDLILLTIIREAGHFAILPLILGTFLLQVANSPVRLQCLISR